MNLSFQIYRTEEETKKEKKNIHFLDKNNRLGK